MKGKLITILLLAVVLAFTVYKMMQFETSLRQEKKIKFYVEDESKPLISKLTYEELKRRAEKSDYYFIADGDYFKILNKHQGDPENQNIWEDIFLKGVNLGVAVPGKFPAEFSLSFDEYLEWFRLIGEMNSNIIRTYTILPPEFYEAFSYYNLHHHNKPLYLMQGVWAEVPEGEDYYDASFKRSFLKEIIHVIDVIHGNAVLREQPGKAYGVYSTDVSKYVAALLLGREWEPGSVFKTNQVNNISSYTGDFVCMNNGNAMEAWLAEMMDFTVLYETQQYSFQHPVSFVNWLPLDPMYHNSEIIENTKVREYDNDLESIDFTRYHSTGLFVPGIYAAYHVYPYYPDFIYLQDSYANLAANDDTKNSYLYYLNDLKQHTGRMPLVIAEYGLPSSRGNSHFSPFGYNQGGHSEAGQARLSLSLTRDIVNSHCAGAIYFEWIDEWFKHNWLVMDFEVPEDDRKIWHNLENPEQNFGIYAMESKTKTIDGELNDWKEFKPSGDKISMESGTDASSFYLALNIPGFDFKRNNLYLAIDTYDKEKGDHKLPFSNQIFENGFEFLAEFKSVNEAALLVDEPYSVFTDIYNGHIPVYSSKKNSNGKFIRQLLLTNRGRVSLLGEKTDSVLFDRSPLQHGKSSEAETSNADWYYNPKKNVFEIRFNWHLLNVSDPAKKYVLNDKAGTPEIEYTLTEAFHIYAFVTDKGNKTIKQYPLNGAYSCTWEGWEIPDYSERLKPIYFTLRDYFRQIKLPVQEKGIPGMINESFRITNFYNNKKGAISISFDNAGYSQYQYGLPVLDKYRLQASFSVIPALLGDASRMHEIEGESLIKRLSNNEVKEIAVHHEIALQSLDKSEITEAALMALNQKSNVNVSTMHCSRSTIPGSIPGGIVFARKSSPMDVATADHNGIKYNLINSGISQPGLDSVLKASVNKWSVIVYHHIYENSSDLPAHLNVNESPGNFISRPVFDRQIRLLRNSNFWIGSEGSVFRYLKEKNASSVQTETFKNMIFLKVIHNLDMNVFNHPLTIEYKTGAGKVRITGSETDGTYENRDGSIVFNVLPNKEITIEILD